MDPDAGGSASISDLCCILGPAAIIVSAAIAWLVHLWIATRRATFDFIANTEIGNSDYTSRRFLFVDVTSGDGQALLDLVNPSGTDQIDKSVKIAMYLGHCEFIAVAIKNKAMNETTYKDWNRSAYVRTWDNAKAYIVARRQKHNQPTLYEHFERLAEKWKEENRSGLQS